MSQIFDSQRNKPVMVCSFRYGPLNLEADLPLFDGIVGIDNCGELRSIYRLDGENFYRATKSRFDGDDNG